MEDSMLFSCLTEASEVLMMIDALEEMLRDQPDFDLTELKITISAVKKTFVLFCTSGPVHKPEFDICVQGILDTLKSIKKRLGIEDIDKKELWECRRVEIYKIDFLLKQRLDQFEALFPYGKESKGVALILDNEARRFWMTTFGEKTFIVPWTTFFHAFEKCIDTSLTREEKHFKKYLDFTKDRFVTPYEFNVFLSWFGPLRGCHKRFLQPLRQGLLGGFIPAVEANEVLVEKPPGTYLIRMSKTKPGSFAVTFVDSRNKIKHCLLYSVQPAGVTLKHPPQVYPSLINFVSAHKGKLKTPLGKIHEGIELDEELTMEGKGLSSLLKCGELTGSSIDGSFGVTAEEHTEKDLCVVCMDEKIETVFLECGHLACCKVCAGKLTECPLCRGPISRVVTIYRP